MGGEGRSVLISALNCAIAGKMFESDFIRELRCPHGALQTGLKSFKTEEIKHRTAYTTKQDH